MPSSRRPGGTGAPAGLLGIGVAAFAVACCGAVPLALGALAALGAGAIVGIGGGFVVAAVTVSLWLRHRKRARCAVEPAEEWVGVTLQGHGDTDRAA
jgi:hypothetical protein